MKIKPNQSQPIGCPSAILLINFVFLLFISTTTFINVVDAGDKCSHLSPLEYELFGTKTIYGDARKYLKKTDDDDLPKSFEDDTLEEEHKDLREDSCEPLVLYFIGRHSARFPDSEDIEQYNKDLDKLIDRMKASTSERCKSKLEDMIHWRTKMTPKHDNLITKLGAKEEREIAKRFKRIYPKFFNTNTADVEIGVTNKIRTAQTGAQFLKEVDGLNLPHCEHIPTDDVDDSSYDLDKIRKAECYQHMMDNHRKEILEFHKQCEKISGDKEDTNPLIERIKDPKIKEKIAAKVAEKLGFDSDETRSREPPVTPEVLGSIFNMCKFENALKDDSVWCDLFDKKDVEALEYIEDVKSYIKDAYGPKAKPEQSCPLVKHLIETMEEETKHEADERKKKAYFYFTHAEVMKKLIATFGMFRDDESFSDSKISRFEDDLSTPKRRQWRSSVMVPFSANMAFILYRCKEPGKPIEYKIMTTLTEQPVKVSGCRDTDCKSEKFFNTYGNLRECNMDKICKRD